MIRDGRGPVAVEAAAARGTVLDGVLFRDAEEAAPDAVVLAVTGIHGNFHSFRGKERETARAVAELVARWRRE